MSLLLGVGVTVAAGLIPALSAAKVTPLEALQPVAAAEYHVAAGRGAIAGVALLLLAVAGLLSGNFPFAALGAMLFLVSLVLLTPLLIRPLGSALGRLLALAFAREGRLGQGNLARQPGRAAVTASAMMISVAVLVAMIGMMASVFAGFFDYLDKSLGADFLVMPPSIVLSAGNVGVDPALAETMGRADGVAGVTSLRLGRTLADGVALQLIGIDPESYSQVAGLSFSDGDEDGAYQALAAGRALFVNGLFAAQNGVGVGDTLVLQTVAGERSYQVVAIATDYLNAKLASGFISQANLAADFGQDKDLLLLANAEPGADPAAVQAGLEELLAAYPAFTLTTSAAWRESQKQVFNAAAWLLHLLVVALAVPGLIALVNTLVINVLERTREIGVLRAIGGSRPQIRRMVLVESLLLAATGTAFGILAGLWLGYVLVGGFNFSGFALDYSVPYTGILLVIAVGLLFGVLASILPARHAARLDIVSALRYE
jgi:putative ABC transport system permease protein